MIKWNARLLIIIANERIKDNYIKTSFLCLFSLIGVKTNNDFVFEVYCKEPQNEIVNDILSIFNHNNDIDIAIHKAVENGLNNPYFLN
jgi:hypothetical protein